MDNLIRITSHQQVRNILASREHDPLLPKSAHRKIQNGNPRLLYGLRKHVIYGEKPGGFLTSVIEGDLFGAIRRADPVSEALLSDIVEYLYNYPPSSCYGSPKKRKRWQKNGGVYSDYKDDPKGLFDYILSRNL